MSTEFLWSEKYRPHKVADVILPPELKATFQKFVDQRNIPNLTLAGLPGVGKTTIAMAMLDELKCDYIIINGSMNGNIDTLRNEISNFASSVSFQGGRKYVILDEADYLNANSTQPALRAFMEQYSENCGFIFTCNVPGRMLDALLSRAPLVDFKIKKSDMAKLALQFFKRVSMILEAENVEFDKAVVAKIIEKFFPDWRRTLNELQRYSASGKIDTGILTNLEEVSIKEMLDLLKAKKFSDVRRWVGENNDGDQVALYRKIYDTAIDFFDIRFIPQLVIILARYQYQAAFSVDPEINIAACLTEIMMDAQWKA